MRDLVAYLEKCDEAYYISGNPLVSDDTYDALVNTLRKTDPENPYLNKVGVKVKSNKIGRLIPMGTLSKFHTSDEVSRWLAEENGQILLAPKYDGFAVELVYIDGELVRASTRGDKYVGEDVYESVLNIPSVPKSLRVYRPKGELIIRGEAIIPTKNHAKMKELGYTAMRNAVPGIVRSNRSDALPYVDFVAYEFLDGLSDRVTQREMWCTDFIVEDYRVYSSKDINKMQERREELRNSEYLYELDGVVLKTNTIKEDDLSCPHHSIAWKYKSNRETTYLRGIEYQMGVTGYFTPIGVFDEVEFQGAKLTRASLGNIMRLRSEFRGLNLGSIIEVSRRGDIIPYIEALVLRDDSNETIEYPTHCPFCGEPLADVDTEPHCTNHSCPERLRMQISQFATGLKVKGIGDKLVTGLISAGYIKDLTDIYRLNPNVILEIPRQGQSAVEKWTALQSKKLTALELFSIFPFQNLGEKVWKSILEHFTVSHILKPYFKEDLLSKDIKGIGESKKTMIIEQLDEFRSTLEWMCNYHGVL